MALSLVPAQVWVGNAQALKPAVMSYLQQVVCLKQVAGGQSGCGVCLRCLQIANLQYHNLVWLKPDYSYKIEQVREVLTRLTFRLAQDEQFFFVFEDAQCLTEASANSLLKSIEEPPLGYHFLFLVPRKELLLETILSRAVIKSISSTAQVIEHGLYQVFTHKYFKQKLISPFDFNLLLDRDKELHDQESALLLDQIYEFWLQQFKKESAQSTSLAQVEAVLAKIQAAQQCLPMPGSSKLFWRNFYMQLCAL